MSDLSPDARELLQVARQEDGPTPAERERLRRAVFGAVAAGSTVLGSAGAAGAVGTGAAAGAGAKLSLVAGTAAKMSTAPLAIWFAVGTAAGLAVVAPVAAVRYVTSTTSTTSTTTRGETRATSGEADQLAQRVPSPAAYDAPAPAALLAAPTPANAEAQTSTEPVPTPATDAKNSRSAASTPNAANAPSTPALAPSALTQELDLLSAAQRELAAGHAEEALARLGEHERRFRSGALRGERLAARVFALCALGRVGDAQSATREFERVAAGSPLTPRVLASCGGTAAGARGK